jgi:hypothetical protein
MNNRETPGRRSPDTGNPGGERKQRQHQREADQLYGRIAPVLLRQRHSGRAARAGIGLTHIYTTKSGPETTKAPDFAEAFATRP